MTKIFRQKLLKIYESLNHEFEKELDTSVNHKLLEVFWKNNRKKVIKNVRQFESWVWKRNKLGCKNIDPYVRYWKFDEDWKAGQTSPMHDWLNLPYYVCFFYEYVYKNNIFCQTRTLFVTHHLHIQVLLLRKNIQSFTVHFSKTSLHIFNVLHTLCRGYQCTVGRWVSHPQNRVFIYQKLLL